MQKNNTNSKYYLIINVAIMFIFICSACTLPGNSENKSYLNNNPNSNNIYFFHDQGYIFMDPIAPKVTDSVTIRIMVPQKTVKSILLCYANSDNKEKSIEMSKEKSDASGYNEYYSAVIPPQNQTYHYRFVIDTVEGRYYYTPKGLVDTVPFTYGEDFIVNPGFDTPQWSKGALWYSIMPDSFYNGDPSNDNRSAEDVVSNSWGNKHEGKADWFGGDLLGIDQQSKAYLKDYLGIDAIFINPVWTTTHNAGYGAFDLKQVNPVLGTEETLMYLTNDLHSNNMKIMLDGVFRYYNFNSIFFNKSNYYPIPGAQQDFNSPYTQVFSFTKYPNEVEKDWGAPILNFSNEFLDQYIYKSQDSVMQTYIKAPYNADGWRMDVGNTLWGKNRNEHDILKDMSTYVKTANPDALFLSEHASSKDMLDYTLDSKWNYDFGTAVRTWASGTGSQLKFGQTLYDAVLRLPRPIALASYNFLTTHDLSRILQLQSNDVTKVNAAQLLLMTFPGAPCIYFGDETGLDGSPLEGVSDAAPTSFSSFNWNKETWNYDILNKYRALSQLRNKYTTLKTGVYKQLSASDKDKIFAFARFDDQAKIVTLINQNDKPVSLKLNLRQISSKLNDEFTDYFTGKPYKVDKEGNVDITVYPGHGGTVLVSGGTSGNFRDYFEIANINNKEDNKSIVMQDDHSFEITTTGSVGPINDKLNFINLPIYNNTEVTVKSDNSGKALMAVRNNAKPDAAMYGAIIDGNSLNIIVRKEDGSNSSSVTKARIKGDSWLKIIRKSGNKFVTYTADDNNGKPAEWVEVKNSLAEAAVDYDGIAGIAGIKGKVKISRLSITQRSPQLGDHFNNSTSGSMLLVEGEGKNQIINSKLQFSSKKDNSFLLSKAPYDDFTFSVKLDSKPQNNGGESMVVYRKNAADYLKTGRINRNGEVFITFERVVNGDVETIFEINDLKNENPVYLLFEKKGTQISAYYSYDNTQWIPLGSSYHYNISDPYVGIMTTENCTTEIDYISYGDYINGGKAMSLSLNNENTATAQSGLSRGEWKIYSGDFKYCLGGMEQTNTNKDGFMKLEKKEIADFYSEVSLRIKKGNAAGISVRIPVNENKPLAGGYTIKVYDDGKIEAVKKGMTIASAVIPKELYYNDTIRITISGKGNTIRVKAGLIARDILAFTDDEYKSGLFALSTFGSQTEFKNYCVIQEEINWIN